MNPSLNGRMVIPQQICQEKAVHPNIWTRKEGYYSDKHPGGQRKPWWSCSSSQKGGAAHRTTRSYSELDFMEGWQETNVWLWCNKNWTFFFLNHLRCLVKTQDLNWKQVTVKGTLDGAKWEETLERNLLGDFNRSQIGMEVHLPAGN